MKIYGVALVLALLGAAPLSAAQADSNRHPPVTRGVDLKAHVGEPRVVGPVSGAMRFKLNAALSIAVDRLHRHAACRALFETLDADAMAVLATTFYFQASTDSELRLCRERRAAAFTNVGGRLTGLCPGNFDRLTPHKASMFLIHEALHHAGMPERTLDSGAMRSKDINTVVRKSCRL